MKNELVTKGLDLESLRKEYLEYIDVSKKTIETYDIALTQFFKYLIVRNIETPTRVDIINFRETLKAEHSVATVNSYLIAIRNFFKFLSYKEIYKNITDNVKGLKDTDIHKREALSLDLCKKLLNSAEDTREKVILMLAISCGLRVNEIANITLEDFKYQEEQYRLYVLGKGRSAKTDFVIIPNDLYELIQHYVKEYGITNDLFVSNSRHNKGERVTSFTIRRIINKGYERLGIKTKTIVAHSLRHSFATLSIESGQDIREVSQALRHRKVTTTETYLHDLEIKNNKCTNSMFNTLTN